MTELCAAESDERIKNSVYQTHVNACPHDMEASREVAKCGEVVG